MTAKPIQLSQLHHYAELQEKTLTPDTGGGSSTSWARERYLWCHIRDLSGSMALESMQRESQIRVEIYARYNRDITTGKRIEHDGLAYLIEAVLRRGTRNEWMHIVAAEGVAT